MTFPSTIACILFLVTYLSMKCECFTSFSVVHLDPIRQWTHLQAHDGAYESHSNQTASFFPLLPPSQVDATTTTAAAASDCRTTQPVAFVAQAKFQLQYTCNICETRNAHQVSRLGLYDIDHFQQYTFFFKQERADSSFPSYSYYYIITIAYRKGVVIAVCKGCKSKHMIADNLGWTNYKGGFEGNTNIEEYMESKGRGQDINRVSTDVFSLEKALYLQSPTETSPDPDAFS